MKLFLGGFTVTVFVCRAVLQLQGLPTPVPQLEGEDTSVEAESWWELIKLFSSSLHSDISRNKAWIRVNHLKPVLLFLKCRRPGQVMFTAWTLNLGLGQKCMLNHEEMSSSIFCFFCIVWKYIYYKAHLFSLVCFWQYCNILSRIPESSTPVGRSWHTLTAVSDSTLFLFGGLSVDCKPMSEKMHQLTYIAAFQLIFSG